jgi:hypothetical protein
MHAPACGFASKNRRPVIQGARKAFSVKSGTAHFLPGDCFSQSPKQQKAR